MKPPTRPSLLVFFAIHRVFYILCSVTHHFVEIAGELRGVFFNGEAVSQGERNDQPGNGQLRCGRDGQHGEDEGEVDNSRLSLADLDAGAIENGKPVIFAVGTHGKESSLCFT